MILKLDSMEPAGTKSLRQRVEGFAERMLGRLKGRVSHAMVSLREHKRATGESVHVCTLRLRVPGSRDTLIESLRADPDAAVAGAFRRARRELMHRRLALVPRSKSLSSPI